MTHPILQRGFEATGTGAWCLERNARRNTFLARANLLWWLIFTADLRICDVVKLTSLHHTTVIYATRTKPRPFVCPAESYRRAMVGVSEGIWARKFRAVVRDRACVEARHKVWAAMLADGCSGPEIARECGCSAGHVNAFAKSKMEKAA